MALRWAFYDYGCFGSDFCLFYADVFYRIFYLEFACMSNKIISPFNWMEYTTQEMQKRGEIKPDTPQTRYNIRRRELLARKKAEQMRSFNNQKI
jgi:hypothetical protein